MDMGSAATATRPRRGERCGGGGEKGRSAGIKRQICKTGKLGKSCYPTNLRVTNPSLFRQSVGRNASMPVVPAPAPTHQRHGVAGVRVVLPPWPRCALRVISSRRGFHLMCIPASRRARIEQEDHELEFDPAEHGMARSRYDLSVFGHGGRTRQGQGL